MAENKERGKERRGSKALNMSAILDLKKFRSTHKCNLRPNKSKTLCASCPDYKQCKGLKGERAYILGAETASAESRKRKKRAGAQEQKSVKDYSSPVYPCHPMDFACPDRATCNEGLHCNWKPE